MARAPQQRGISIRLSLEDAARVKAELERLGIDGGAAIRRIEASAAPASTSLRAVNVIAAEGRGVMEGYARSLGPVGSGLIAFGPAGLAAAAGIGVAAAALTKVVTVGRDAEQAQLKIQALIRTTGGAAGRTAEQIDALALDLARATLASTNGVREAAAQLLTFKSVAGEVFDETLVLAQDLAALGFGNLEGATKQLGKALEDPVRGLSSLREVGVSFTAEQERMVKAMTLAGDKAGAQAAMLQVLRDQIGGAGTAQGSGLSGALDTLGVELSNITEKFFAATAAGQAFVKYVQLAAQGLRINAEAMAPSIDRRLYEVNTAIGVLERQRDAVAAEVAQMRQYPAGTFGPEIAAREQVLAGQNERLAALYEQRTGILAEIKVKEDEVAAAAAKSAAAQKRGADEAAAALLRNRQAWDDLNRSVVDAQAALAAARAGADVVDIQDLAKARDLLLQMGKAAKLETTDTAELSRLLGVTVEQIAEKLRAQRLLQQSVDATVKARQREYEILKQDLSTPDPPDPGLASRMAADKRLDALDRELEKRREILEAQKLDETARAAELALIEEKYRALEAGAPLDDADLERVRQKAVALAEVDVALERSREAAREYQRVWDHALENIQDSFRDTFRDALEGNLDDGRSFAERFKSLMFDMIADIGTAMIFRPVIAPVVQSVAGAIGGATGLPVPNIAGGGLASGGGGIGDLLGLGSQLGGLGEFAGGINAWLNQTGGALGFATSAGATLGGAEAAAMAGDLAEAAFLSNNAGTLFGGTTLSGFLGGAGIGSGLASLMGLGSGNFLLDTGAGLAGAAIGQLLIPIPGVGAGIGSFAGTALAGLFGGQKPSVGPNAYAESLVGPAGWRLWETGADNGGDAGSLAAVSQQVGDAFAELVAGIGATVTNTVGFHLGNFPSQGGIWTRVSGASAGLGTARQTFGQDSEAAFTDVLLDLFRVADLGGISDEMQAAIRTSAGLRDSMAEFASDLELIRLVLDGDPFEIEKLTAAEQALKALGERFDALAEQATELGLPIAVLEQRRAEAEQALLTGFEDAIAAQILAIEDPLAAALQAFEAAAETQRKEAEALGADMVAIERLQALQRAQIVEQYGDTITEHLRRSLADAATAIETGDGSALAAGDRLAIAQADWQQALAAARAGDADAAGRLAGAGQTFLELSAAVNTRGAAFASDQAAVVAALREVAGVVAPLGGSGVNDNDPAAALAAAAEQQHRDAVDRALNEQIFYLAGIERNTGVSADRLGRLEAGQGRVEALLRDIRDQLAA